MSSVKERLSIFRFDFPKEVMNIMTLTENDGLTMLHLTGYPINTSEEEE